MARISVIISGVIFLLAGWSAAGAQTPGRPQVVQPNGQQAPRVIPAPGAQTPAQPGMQSSGQPSTAPNQPNQPNMQSPGQQRMTSPGQPQTAPLKPAVAGTPDGQPATPANPPSPPQVTYRDGLLTVQAANSSLNSVLAAIRSKTGIEFEGQENVSDRVALSLGPAPAGEVLSAIFTGSRFDFLAIGRQDNPSIVQRVILTPKTQAGQVAAAPQQPRPNNNGGNPDEEDTPDETPNVGDPQPQDTPAQVPQAQQQTPPQGSKSPEQLLQELQEMRKQQQMQQEGAPQANPNQVPRKPPMVPR